MFKGSGISPSHEDFNAACDPVASLPYSNLNGDIPVMEFGISLYADNMYGMCLTKFFGSFRMI